VCQIATVGTTQSYIYNGRPIESRISSIERRHFNNNNNNNGFVYDLEQPLSPVSRSRHSLMQNISETVWDTDIVAMKY